MTDDSMVTLTGSRTILRQPIREDAIPSMSLPAARSARQAVVRVLAALDRRVAALEGVAASDRAKPPPASAKPLTERLRDARQAIKPETPEAVRERAAAVKAAITGRKP